MIMAIGLTSPRTVDDADMTELYYVAWKFSKIFFYTSLHSLRSGFAM